MKSVLKTILLSLVICFLIMSLISCNDKNEQEQNQSDSSEAKSSVDSNESDEGTKNTVALTSVEAGLEFEQPSTDEVPPQVPTILYCGYKFDSNIYDVNTPIPATIYYGADIEEKPTGDESYDPIKIFISNAYDEEKYMLVKEMMPCEIMDEKYDLTKKYGKNGFISSISYNYNEKIEIPFSMFTGNGGALHVAIRHYDDNIMSRYGIDSQIIYYKIQNGKVIISNERILDEN